MLIAEARWLSERLAEIEAISPLLHVGSASEDFRVRGQPWIDEMVFRPLRARGVSVVHVDAQAARGVDVVGDLTDPDCLARLREEAPRSILCSNLLEHLRDRGPLCQAMVDILPASGWLLVTVPFRYPYHADPIDTMYRPDVRELAATFPGTRLVRGDVVRCGTWWDYVATSPRAVLMTLIRLCTPWRSPRSWFTAVCHVPWIFRRFEATCVVLQKV
ncbi:MAG: methyltransferase type 11 [Armatimonadetes bacterium]|nr:methyltransferase type 11 [Armatimonadota bacterium]MBM4438410.1 methyltransferase type 11 [Actinomycetota bacterium]